MRQLELLIFVSNAIAFVGLVFPARIKSVRFHNSSTHRINLCRRSGPCRRRAMTNDAFLCNGNYVPWKFLFPFDPDRAFDIVNRYLLCFFDTTFKGGRANSMANLSLEHSEVQLHLRWRVYCWQERVPSKSIVGSDYKDFKILKSKCAA